MNTEEAKYVLLGYRPHTGEAPDPDTVEALALAKGDPELGRWLAEHYARQDALRAKFRSIKAPAGLKEQIISEQILYKKAAARKQERLVAALAVVAVIAGLFATMPFWLSCFKSSQPTGPSQPEALAMEDYQARMSAYATLGYAMELLTNDPAQIRAYLAQKDVPADYTLPAGLAQAELAGCAIPLCDDKKVALICFRTGRPLPAKRQSDLWLFVVDRAAVKSLPPEGTKQFGKTDQLTTVVWTEGNKLYLLGTTGDDQTLRKFL